MFWSSSLSFSTMLCYWNLFFMKWMTVKKNCPLKLNREKNCWKKNLSELVPSHPFLKMKYFWTMQWKIIIWRLEMLSKTTKSSHSVWIDFNENNKCSRIDRISFRFLPAGRISSYSNCDWRLQQEKKSNGENETKR